MDGKYSPIYKSFIRILFLNTMNFSDYTWNIFHKIQNIQDFIIEFKYMCVYILCYDR